MKYKLAYRIRTSLIFFYAKILFLLLPFPRNNGIAIVISLERKEFCYFFLSNGKRRNFPNKPHYLLTQHPPLSNSRKSLKNIFRLKLTRDHFFAWKQLTLGWSWHIPSNGKREQVDHIDTLFCFRMVYKNCPKPTPSPPSEIVKHPCRWQFWDITKFSGKTDYDIFMMSFCRKNLFT